MSTVVVCITVVALLSVVMLDVLVSVDFGVVSDVVVTEDNVVPGDVVVTDVVVAAVADVVVLSCVVEGGVGQSASKEGVTVLSGIPRAYNLCIIDTNIPISYMYIIRYSYWIGFALYVLFTYNPF